MLRVDAILKATDELKVDGSGVRWSDPEGKVYEIIGDLGQHEYTKAKSVQPENTSYRSSTNTKGIEIGHAINNAVNMICAGVEFDNVDSEIKTGQKIEAYARNILAISNKLKNE